MDAQSPGSPTRDSFGKKCHSDVSPAGSCREYYMGEGGAFPPSPGHGESIESKVARG
jgi:hypothetical protein